MNFVGIDLHKKTNSVCVVDQERNVLYRKRFNCSEPDRLVAFLEQLGPFEAVGEADDDGGAKRVVYLELPLPDLDG